jgi:hypothetical protein
MSPLNKALGLVGIAKQTAKGTLAANPTFAHGVVSGKAIMYALKQDYADVTSGNSAPTNVDRTQADAGMAYDTRAYLKVLGLYLLGLFGADVVTGTTPNFVHTFGLAASQPYLSGFESYNGLLEAVRDLKIDGLTLKWTANQPVVLTIAALGTVWSVPTTFVAATDETGSESFLVPVGGTFQVAMVGNTPVTARVTDGEIDFKNALAAVFASGAIEADDPGCRGRHEATVKLTVIPEDMALWKATVTGTGTGTAVAPGTQYGSLAVTFKENAGTGGLAITGSKVAFLCERPDIDPGGGSMSLALAGQAVMASGAVAPLVCALTNSVATY